MVARRDGLPLGHSIARMAKSRPLTRRALLALGGLALIRRKRRYAECLVLFQAERQ